MEKISDVVKEIKESQEKEYHRGKSWEHCYVFFRRNYKKFRNDTKLLDHAALHLGFFLASWGMLRGSSFLLQKDYKFYVPIVETLINSNYDKLWNINFLKESKGQDIKLLFDLKNDLTKKIKENNRIDGDDKEHQMDLIITKIIMATMGCVPGYDRYFKAGLKQKMEKGNNFNPNSFKNLLNFSISRENDELKKAYKKLCFIKGTKIKYPPMKLLDLYFWLLGHGSEK